MVDTTQGLVSETLLLYHNLVVDFEYIDSRQLDCLVIMANLLLLYHESRSLLVDLVLSVGDPKVFFGCRI